MEIVLGLNVMELLFPTAALTVLRFEFMARKVLITYQCLGTNDGNHYITQDRAENSLI